MILLLCALALRAVSRIVDFYFEILLLYILTVNFTTAPVKDDGTDAASAAFPTIALNDVLYIFIAPVLLGGSTVSPLRV